MVFPKWTNLAPTALLVPVTVVTLGLVFAIWYWATPKNTFVGYQPAQPIPYSHKLHAGQLGIDCRYCHFNVERGPHAGVPSTDICMNCHSVVRANSPEIKKIAASYKSGTPIKWVRVYKLPDFAYFDHSAHVNKGVSCVVCHGRVDQMDVVQATSPLSMSWCLQCHRNPAPNIRDKKLVTNLAWKPEGDPAALGREFMDKYHVNPRTDCSACHR